MTDPTGPYLLTNATVHSTSEPYAEAMIVEDGLIAWVGSETTAEHLRDERFVVEDAQAALATPAFFGWIRRPVSTTSEELVAALDGAAAAGIGTVRLVVEQVDPQHPEVFDEVVALLRAAAGHPLTVHPVLELASDTDHTATDLVAVIRSAEDASPAGAICAVGLPESVWSAEGPTATILSTAQTCAEAARQLVLTVPEGAEPQQVLDVVAALRRSPAQGGAGMPPADRPTVLYGFDSPRAEDWEGLIGQGVHVVLTRPGHLAAALRAGVPASAAPSEGEDPWALVSAHVHATEDPVSVRAAFNAQVRGAHRMVSGLPAGQLNPGAVATYALWDVDSLAVQTPDSRTAAWSTDARARTPLLPYLDGMTLPHLRRTVVAGRTVAQAPQDSTENID